MTANVYPCPICRRSGWITRDGIERHLAEDHSPAVLATELASHAFPPLAAATAPKPTVPICKKVGYASQQDALRALLSTWQAHGPRRCETRAYQCDRCSKWHLTKQPERTES